MEFPDPILFLNIHKANSCFPVFSTLLLVSLKNMKVMPGAEVSEFGKTRGSDQQLSKQKGSEVIPDLRVDEEKL